MSISGAGTIFQRWNSTLSTPAWETISSIKTIGGPSATRAVLDTTSLDTAGGYRTFISGFRDAGEITLTMNFNRAGYDKMIADFQSDTTGYYEIVLPDTDSTSIEFEGLVSGIPLTIPEDVVTVAITIKISGAITINSGPFSGTP